MDWKYLFKHWFATIILAPFVLELILYFSNPKIGGLVHVYHYALLFSLLFSIPTYLVYAAVFKYLIMKKLDIRYSKIILILIALLGVFISFYIMMGFSDFEFTSSYLITSLITGLIFKLRAK